jgi:hypothetical protein
MGVIVDTTQVESPVLEVGDPGPALEGEAISSPTGPSGLGFVCTEDFSNLANAAAWLIGERLAEAVTAADPVLQGLRQVELDAVKERGTYALVGEDPVGYLKSRNGGMYLAVEAGTTRCGEHQIVAPLGNGLVIKTKVGEQQLERQTSGDGDKAFVRVGAEPYQWENLTAEVALGEIGISVPIVPTRYYKAQWVQNGERSVPSLIPVNHPGSSFKHTRETWAATPNVAIALDVSQGGSLSVHEFFDQQIRTLQNYDEMVKEVDAAAGKILQYCEGWQKENGNVKTSGYVAGFSLHAHPEPGYSVYESEVRRIFFVVVDPQAPTVGRLVIGDLDGITLRRE